MDSVSLGKKAGLEQHDQQSNDGDGSDNAARNGR
jgi:hypothetical protein